jgi:hypothetical protein
MAPKDIDWFGYFLVAVTIAMIIFFIISLVLGK